MGNHGSEWKDRNHFVERDRRTVGEAVLMFARSAEEFVGARLEHGVEAAKHVVQIAHALPELVSHK